MATRANFRLSGLDSVLYSGYFYLFIYAFVRFLGHVSCGRMPGFQSFSLASYVSPADKYSECSSKIKIYAMSHHNTYIKRTTAFLKIIIIAERVFVNYNSFHYKSCP